MYDYDKNVPVPLSKPKQQVSFELHFHSLTYNYQDTYRSVQESSEQTLPKSASF